MTIVTNPMALSAPGFRPLAQMLQRIVPERLETVRVRVAALSREEVISRFRSSFNDDKRLEALVMADDLIAKGIPPCFWHSAMPSEPTLEQRYDLMLFDLRWLRYWHADHYRHIRYDRYREILLGTEPGFHRAAEFAFYFGRRPAWKIVGSMSLTERQQWDCVWLRLTPLKKHQKATEAMQQHILETLQNDLLSVRRTASFTQDSADIALARRTALWVCSRMTEGSPTETALRYTQMTGEQITRQTVGKQLEKIRDILRKNEMTSHAKAKMSRGVRVPFSRT